jgi:hypothetical protein
MYTMKPAFLLLVIAASVTPLHAALRLYNSTEREATATITCGAASRSVSIAAGAIVDTEDSSACRVVVPEGVSVIDTQGNQQRLVPRTLDSSCSGTVAVSLPLFGCRLGSASASVAPAEGATYAWSVAGGTIINGNGTPRVIISFADTATAQVSVAVASGQCSTPGQGVVALHDAFTAKLVGDAGRVGEPLTINWTFSGGEPVTQTLSGTDFPEPIALAPGARSYTYSPTAAGAKEAWITASSAPPPPARRRAAVGTRDGASPCTSVQTSSTYHVEECAKPGFSIHAPKSVLSGATFEARAEGNATTVHWTIVNGSPATWEGQTVTIHAGDSGKVEISAVGERPPCHNTASDSLSVEIVKELACDHPAASVLAGKSDCNGASVEATFEGTPPFAGTWSDGATFSTKDYHLSRRVSTPGTYSITKFEDSICTGTSSGAAVIQPSAPTATLSSKTSCARDNVTVQFTGKPPFTGQWSDGVPFTSTAMTMQRKTPDPDPLAPPFGPFTIAYFTDTTDCIGKVSGGFNVHEVPKVYVSSGWPAYLSTDCISHPPPAGIGNGTYLIADFQFGELPLTAVWSDGTVVTQAHWPTYRVVDPQETTTYKVVSAHDKWCEAEIVIPSTTIWVSQRPEIVLPDVSPADNYGICFHKASSARLDKPLQPGTTVNWTVQNGTITGGQGTDAITFTTGENGPSTISCTFTFNDKRCPTDSSRQINVWGIPSAPVVSVSPSTIPPGGTATITYKYGPNTSIGYASASRKDEITAVGQFCPDNVCQALFHDVTGPGAVTITIHAKGYCSDQEVTGSATVTVSQ